MHNKPRYAHNASISLVAYSDRIRHLAVTLFAVGAFVHAWRVGDQ